MDKVYGITACIFKNMTIPECIVIDDLCGRKSTQNRNMLMTKIIHSLPKKITIQKYMKFYIEIFLYSNKRYVYDQKKYT